MKVLHTADWHLGQRLAGHDRAEEHARFLKWLLTTIREKQVELLIVAGDVFDSAHPPQATMQLYYNFLRDLSALERCGAVFVGGNHDSPAHLNAPSGLLKRFQIHVVGSPSAEREEDLIKISPAANLLDSVCVCAVPYLRDRDVLQVVVGEATGLREERLREGIYHYYQDMRERAQSHRDLDIPLLATGHLTMHGSSEQHDQELQIGTLSALEETHFPQDFDYVALGHLHEPHAVGGRVWMRYAGSPFPMSFSEADHEKSVVLLDFKQGQLRSCDTLPIPVFRRLHRYGGTLTDLQRWVKTAMPREEDVLTPWLEVHLTDDEDHPHLPEKVMEVLHDEPLEVLKIITQRRESPTKVWQNPDSSLQEYRPAEVFAERCRVAGLEEDDLAQCEDTFAELLALHEAKRLELVD